MPSLVIHTPDGRQSTVELREKTVKVGRADTCDVVLHDDAEVSREHAEVWIDERGRIVVADRGSKNGTRVDDGDVFRGAKRHAYRSIRIGEHELRIVGAATTPSSDDRIRFVPDNATRVGDTQFFPSTRKLDLNAQRLQLLIQLTERIGGVFERKELLEQALDACCEALGFERGLIALKTQRGDPEMPVTRNVGVDETGAFKISRTLINRALVNGERAIVNNPATDLVGNITESLVRFPICSALCVPILFREEILGVIYGDRVTQAATYQPGDVDFLAAIAQQVGVGIANLRMFQEYLRAQKLFAELDQARGIQTRLLPDRALTLGPVTFEGHNEPSAAVSGDYYDYFPLDENRIGFVIADVTGHGLAAALMMANLQSAIRVALSRPAELSDLAARINRLICENTDSHVFITAAMGVVDVASRAVEYISAGHPGPLVLKGPRAQPENPDNSLPLGIDPTETFAVQRISLDGGPTTLLFYTDGLVEATNPAGDLMGLDSIVTRLSEVHDLSTNGVIRSARAALREFMDGAPRADDMTLLAAHFSC
ncbi:MAG: SpoIIE family protein phosphatase [Planctomycetes bacterium]|nr:SpoIIE family protein phosphatase [Planctomycetota bacterium]